jgi:hypothetical protein
MIPWFEPSKNVAKKNLKQPQVDESKTNPILCYLNSLIVNQVEYILDTIETNGLDFFNAG